MCMQQYIKSPEPTVLQTSGMIAWLDPPIHPFYVQQLDLKVIIRVTRSNCCCICSITTWAAASCTLVYLLLKSVE